ncbi:MAG: ABC transporter permease [Proteobacteria bacterium]|nr:ABC transporter permease [Pseudomonadota bacterium]
MALPLIYNLRSVRVRWASTSIAVLGIAGVVAVFIAMLSMARGFKATLVASGLPSNAIVRRGGSLSEMESAITIDQVRIASDAPGVMRTADGLPLISPEVVMVASIPQVGTGINALIQVRGVSKRALEIRDVVKISEGGFFRTGLAEIVVGRNLVNSYQNCKIGDSAHYGGRDWTVVGILDSGGSAFDSEIWCDAFLLNQSYNRPASIYQSATVRLTSPDALFEFKNALSNDPRLTVTVERETEYYERQSQVVTTMIRVLGFLVVLIMGIGAVFGALNTMYSAVAARVREIATIRSLGFGRGSIIISFLCESVIIALIGGIIGCIAVLPINGYTASTLNFQTFSNLAFAFKITPDLLIKGILFALFMGLLGGLFPAIRAARLPVAEALRAL